MAWFNFNIVLFLTCFTGITTADIDNYQVFVFQNLHEAVFEAVKADDKKNVIITYTAPFEDTVSYLMEDLFSFNCTVTLFFIHSGEDSFEQVSNYIVEIKMKCLNVITINLLKGYNNSKLIQLMRSVKRPNKHIFLADANNVDGTLCDFINWEDEVLTTVFILPMARQLTHNSTSEPIGYLNLPCEDEDLIHCTTNWTPGHYDPNYKILSYEKLLKTRTFTVAIIEGYFTPANNSKLSGTAALEYKLLQFLSSFIGFKYDIKEYKFNDWGKKLQNGTWIGLFSLVLNGVADMIICELSMTEERSHVADFSHIYKHQPTAILSRAPSTDYSPFLIFRPLDLNVWIIVLLIVFMSGAAFKLMLLFAQVNPTGASTLSENTVVGLSSCFFHSYRVFFGHSVWEPSNQFSVRFFTVLLNILGFFVIVIYSGRLISALSYRQQASPVDSLYDLLREVQNGKKLTLKNGSLLAAMFEQPDEGPPIYNEIYKAAQLTNALQYIKSGNEYFDVFDSIGENGGTVVREISQLHEYLTQPNVDSTKYHISSSVFATTLYAIAMKRGFRLKSDIDKGIRLLSMHGVLDHWYEENLTDVRKKQNVALNDCAIQLYDLLGAWFIFAVGLPLTECGRNHVGVQSEKRIFGGLTAEKHEFPWIVAFVKAESLKTIHCGGSLISERHVLSAAHCFKGLSPDKLVLYIGIENLNDIISNKQASYYIQKIIIHDDYSSSGDHDNDLAIVETKKSVTFSNAIQPICIGNSEMDTPGIITTVAGFGHANKIKLIGIANSDLRSAELPIKEPAFCETYPRFKKSTMICAGHKGRGACQGDSGSPMMVKLDDQWFVIGVTTSGGNCYDKFSVTTYTKVSIHLTWIIETVEKFYDSFNSD